MAQVPVSKEEPVSGDEYAEICRFLFDEAELLSAGAYAQWEALLADDIHYVVPVPTFQQTGQERELGTGNPYFDEDIHSLRIRVRIFEGPNLSTAENPPAKLRHFVTNVRAWRTENSHEYRVKAALLLYRVRYTQPEPFLLAGQRTDLLRRVGGGFKLARRRVDIEQTSIQAPNMSFLL